MSRPNGGVAVIVVHQDRKSYAVSRRINEQKSFYRYFQFPGGTVDANENVFQAAQRELKEETGLELNESRFVLLGSDERVNPRGGKYMGYCFLVLLKEGEKLQDTEPTVQTPWTFCTINTLRDLQMIPGLMKYVEDLQ